MEIRRLYLRCLKAANKAKELSENKKYMGVFGLPIFLVLKL